MSDNALILGIVITGLALIVARVVVVAAWTRAATSRAGKPSQKGEGPHEPET